MADEYDSAPPQPAEHPAPEEAPLRSSADQAAGPEETARRRDRLWALLAGAVVVILVILFLLLLPRCAASNDPEASNPQGKEIVAVPPLDPMDGVVSVWVKPDTTIDEVLKKAAVSTDDSVDMGDGRFIITVPKGSEADAVSRLKASQGIYDAGRVYGEEGAAVK